MQKKKSSMHEGLQLFEEVVQNPIFQNTPIFVFLNKKDLFEQMMEQGIPLSRCFPDYRVSGGHAVRFSRAIGKWAAATLKQASTSNEQRMSSNNL